MSSRIQKWGNSLGLRIPKHLADEMGLAEGTEVDLAVDDNRLVVSHGRAPRISLEEILRRVTSRNLHDGIDTGDPVGREIW